MDAQVLGGGLGFASAHRVRTASHFASWPDSLIMVRKRHSHCSDNDQGEFPTRSRLPWNDLSLPRLVEEAELEPNQPKV